MDFGFSTMGEPALHFGEATQLATEFELQFLELRGLGGNLHLPDYFQLAGVPSRLSVPVRLVASSFHLDAPSPESFRECIAFAELAVQLQAPFLRVFADGGGGKPSAESIARAAATARKLRAELLRRRLPVEPLLETHGGYSFSTPCLELNRALDRPLGLLWDSHHTWKIGGETPAETWRQLGPFVRHVHYKDSVVMEGRPTDYRYVPPGTGQFPTADLFGLLQGEDFNGGLSLEWEKQWHPELAPLREVLPAFTKILREARSPLRSSSPRSGP